MQPTLQFMTGSLVDGEKSESMMFWSYAWIGRIFSFSGSFFFSSRRRHTRCLSDWSSDVCSSDLEKTMIAPSLRHLRHLTALAEHRHFGRAAVASRVTQSTLSASIKELERLLEATLVDRSKRRVVFTPLGDRKSVV